MEKFLELLFTKYGNPEIKKLFEEGLGNTFSASTSHSLLKLTPYMYHCIICSYFHSIWLFTPTFVLSIIFWKFLDFHFFGPTFLLNDHHATSITTCIYWSAGTCGRLARVKESTAVNHQLITAVSNWRVLASKRYENPEIFKNLFKKVDWNWQISSNGLTYEYKKMSD